MRTLHALLFLTSLSIVMMDPDYRAVWELRGMILCKLPNSWPLLDYGNYGCYCGLGGAGIPVDSLDRCCMVHDHCYSAAMKLQACEPILENPYTLDYSYTCDKETKEITCAATNNACEMFVCECDFHAATCFAGAGYNKSHHDLNQELCK